MVPPCYFIIPGFAWDCFLKMTKQETELIAEYDMILMIENGIRGEISQSSNRQAKANMYMNGKLNENKKKRFLQYLDANNLNGWAMS